MHEIIFNYYLDGNYLKVETISRPQQLSDGLVSIKINNQIFSINPHRWYEWNGCIMYLALDRFLDVIYKSIKCQSDSSKLNTFFQDQVSRVKQKVIFMYLCKIFKKVYVLVFKLLFLANKLLYNFYISFKAKYFGIIAYGDFGISNLFMDNTLQKHGIEDAWLLRRVGLGRIN